MAEATINGVPFTEQQKQDFADSLGLVRGVQNPVTGVIEFINPVTGDPIKIGGLPDAVAWSSVIPLDGIKTMAQHSVSGALAFAVPASLTEGSECHMTLIANGVNIPTFGAFRKWGGSANYVNTIGAINEITFFVLNGRAYYSISQASPVEIYATESVVRFNALMAMAESGDATNGYTYTTTATSNQVAKSPSLSLAGNGYVHSVILGTGAVCLGLDANPADVIFYAGLDYAIYPHSSGVYKVLENGTGVTPNANASVAVVVGDKMKLSRSGSSVQMGVVRADGSEVVVHNAAATSSATLYPLITGVATSGVATGPVKISGGS